MPPKKDKYTFLVFQELFAGLSADVEAGRGPLSILHLPLVEQPDVSAAALNPDTPMRRALASLPKHKHPKTAVLGEVLRYEGVEKLAGSLDAPAIMSVLVAVYLAEYVPEVAEARHGFAAATPELRMKIASDVDVFPVQAAEPNGLQLAAMNMLVSNDAVGQLCVAVHHDTRFSKGEMLIKVHGFLVGCASMIKAMKNLPPSIVEVPMTLDNIGIDAVSVVGVATNIPPPQAALKNNEESEDEESPPLDFPMEASKLSSKFRFLDDEETAIVAPISFGNKLTALF